MTDPQKTPPSDSPPTSGHPIELTLTTAAGQRLDKALTHALPQLSRMQWQRLIQNGQVTLDGQPLTRPAMRIQGGETVVAVLPAVQPAELQPEDIPLDIRYEDADMLVVNKPAGMVVHPGTGHYQGTLANAVLHHCPDLRGVGGEMRPGIVHRLDKQTSGVIVIAKHDHALWHLQAQFKQRQVQKQYLALVVGHIQPPAALIDAPIGRDPNQRQKMAVIPPGSSASLRAREARTSYTTRASYDGYTLVACDLHTGRTHQIRVHLAYIGFPVVGDTIYGRRRRPFGLRRHFLHAAALTLRRPADDQTITVAAELPPELQQIVDQLAAA